MPSLKYKDVIRGQVSVPPYLKIRYKGTWDMQDLYESTISWLRDRKWKFHEKAYKHKHPSAYGIERQYVWLAEQNVDDWVNITLDVYIHTYDAHDVEVTDKKGQRKILTKGKIWVTLKITEHWDYSQNFFKNKFLATIGHFYIMYIVKKRRMQGYSPRYRHELVALYQFMQRKLQMDTAENEYAQLAGVHQRGPR